MKRFCVLLPFMLFFAIGTRAQDVHVNCSLVQSCTLTPAGGLPWANGNLTWIFRPLNPRVSIYIFIRNYNTTNAHTSQTITVWQTPFSQDIASSVSQAASRWTQDTLAQNSTVGASCNNVNAANDSTPGASGLGTCYVTTVFASQVAIKITGAATQAGAIDNFDLAIVQETGAPMAQLSGGSSTQTTLNPIIQPAATTNFGNTSGLNSSQTVVFPAVPNKRNYLFGFSVWASGGAPSCYIFVYDGAVPIWSTDTNFVTLTTKGVAWPVPLASAVGNSMSIMVTACGAGISSTISYQESVL